MSAQGSSLLKIDEVGYNNAHMDKIFFTFHGDLSDFLKKEKEGDIFPYELSGKASVKDIIESLGIPHPEVALILIRGKPVSFEQALEGGEKIDVYGRHCIPSHHKGKQLPFMPEGKPAFILDVHLGRLARYLRVAGFDTSYEKDDPGDRQIAEAADQEERILLTRDIGLLKRKKVTYGHWLRSTESRSQFREVVRHYDLKGWFDPFSRCIRCNGTIRKAVRAEVEHRLCSGVQRDYDDFYICSGCGQIYWKGSHYRRIRELLASV